MLDDKNVLVQRDSERTLETSTHQFEQARLPVEVLSPEYDGRDITKVVVAGMGGSALAAILAKTWLDNELAVPFEVVRAYELPSYVDYNTLVIASSCSGNTEETLACLEDAQKRFAQIAVITGGGELMKLAEKNNVARVILPILATQPRMLTIAQLRALTALLAHFGVVNYDRFGEIADTADWLMKESQAWESTVTTDKNYAKQLALQAVGKTPVFYGGPLMRSAAYKWKISWNENAKNLAFWNEYPEFNHNEFLGWSSHPIEKPFAIFDIISKLEHPQVLKRFAISDRLLSGRRPKAQVIQVKGETVLKQLLWANILADFASIYVGILNNVDPGPVVLANKLKEALHSTEDQ
ncbi:MAG: pgi, glucose-6-phosphate isomerase [Candidatus Saccharibacteria bacterium]|nr:pgi, glucose-6-phosphate isomerase [Candidatus Saccharibacteria bacterium]